MDTINRILKLMKEELVKEGYNANIITLKSAPYIDQDGAMHYDYTPAVRIDFDDWYCEGWLTHRSKTYWDDKAEFETGLNFRIAQPDLYTYIDKEIRQHTLKIQTIMYNIIVKDNYTGFDKYK